MDTIGENVQLTSAVFRTVLGLVETDVQFLIVLSGELKQVHIPSPGTTHVAHTELATAPRDTVDNGPSTILLAEAIVGNPAASDVGSGIETQGWLAAHELDLLPFASQTCGIAVPERRCAGELDLEPYAAARLATALRTELVKPRESFVLETVFSNPVGDKLAFLKQAVESGYTVVLCYIGIAGLDVSEARVAMRVSEGGHDVPTDKVRSRFPRTIMNLKAAIRDLQQVLVYDNDDLRASFRHVAAFEQGRLVLCREPVPAWLRPLLR